MNKHRNYKGLNKTLRCQRIQAGGMTRTRGEGDKQNSSRNTKTKSNQAPDACETNSQFVVFSPMWFGSHRPTKQCVRSRIFMIFLDGTFRPCSRCAGFLLAGIPGMPSFLQNAWHGDGMC